MIYRWLLDILYQIFQWTIYAQRDTPKLVNI